ncbi:3-isopropylmalate dehydratase large subunit [Picrophilus oshimae]|uniref:3-isopropylmalate/(R)-2-methylmalate dehydratase large subunit n=1 Tax=Picrophilus torridus (strain ATCC 700027 / DSM 9790 / JCM 10055 / NBRC 100828 / KAW 2/3) TaxID=1122961 RepID=A0A8G2L7D7_PICTO|nr:aconitase/3-isopropylmalate dehydratase large subunit family protein [Picrophilus oshimae]SMD30880.1 3-isopropylmalate/(R)-2-methylmalate dehydratase large subunit [Picrophilus oshimae DSM 9789]
MNAIEKILALHSDKKNVSPGDIVEVSVDMAIILDIIAMHNEFINNPPLKPFDKDKIAIIFDHFVPAPSIEIANRLDKIRKLARIWNIKNFFDYSGGISHVLAAENRWILPGSIIANTDSHTVNTGAYNSLGRGLGTPEIMSVIATGRTWFIVGETINVVFKNYLKSNVSAKDIFFYMAKTIGSIPNKNIEFSGNLKSLTIDDRASISTMCAEMNVEFALFPNDDVLRAYMSNRSLYNVVSDGDYSDQYEIDLNEVQSMVARPGKIIDNIVNAGDEKTEITQAVIGSCANGRLSDIRDAARILKNKKINKNVRLIVTPASMEIYKRALELGYIKDIIDAGGIVTNPTCGACLGGHMGIASDNDVIISSTTRNFQGRMGSPGARIYLGSAATVAASALNGYITDPGDLQ